MTTVVPEYIDAIGQKITPGDFVISIRDGTGAKPRMALKFSPSKVSVSCSYSTSQSYMDACSLVVITSNLNVLKDQGDSAAEKCMNDLKSKFTSMIVHAAPKTAAVPIRWIVVAHGAEGNRSGTVPVQFVSMHQVNGTAETSFSEGSTEAVELSKSSECAVVFTMVRKTVDTYYNRVGSHWDWGGVYAKDGLFPLKALQEIGLEALETNKLIPVDVFNSMVPPTHRITKV